MAVSQAICAMCFFSSPGSKATRLSNSVVLLRFLNYKDLRYTATAPVSRRHEVDKILSGWNGRVGHIYPMHPERWICMTYNGYHSMTVGGTIGLGVDSGVIWTRYRLKITVDREIKNPLPDVGHHWLQIKKMLSHCRAKYNIIRIYFSLFTNLLY